MDIRPKIVNSIHELGRFHKVSAVIAVIAQVLAAFAFPILEAILRENANNLPAYVLYSVYVFHVAFGVLATWALLKGRDFIAATNITSLLESVDDIERRYNAEQAKTNSFRLQTETLLAKSAAIQGSLSVLQGLLQHPAKRDIRKADIKAILAPLIKDRTRALEFTADDLYNFVV